MESHENAMEVRHLRKAFGILKAVDGIDFELKQGEFLTVFGPNGAGKTTLIKILSGLTKPTSGEAKVAGFNVIEGNSRMRKEIGVISHATALYADLTPLENLMFFARMHGLDKPQEQSLKVIDEVGLSERRNDRVRTFSRGMLQRLSIARAILHDPTILFLDEPTASLDPDIANKIRAFLKEYRDVSGLSMLYTSHNMREMEEMSDRIIFLQRGKIVAQGTALSLIHI